MLSFPIQFDFDWFWSFLELWSRENHRYALTRFGFLSPSLEESKESFCCSHDYWLCNLRFWYFFSFFSQLIEVIRVEYFRWNNFEFDSSEVFAQLVWCGCDSQELSQTITSVWTTFDWIHIFFLPFNGAKSKSIVFDRFALILRMLLRHRWRCVAR